MASPVYTAGAAGNLLASYSLGPLASVGFDVDVSAAFEALVQVVLTATSVTNLAPTGNDPATGQPYPPRYAGVKVAVYAREGNPAAVDSTSAPSWPASKLTAAANATVAGTDRLPTGRWRVVLTSDDPNNAFTVAATGDTIGSVT